MNQLRPVALACLLATLLVTLLGPSARGMAAGATPAGSCSLGWHIVTSPNPYSALNQLNAVVTLSGSNAWAVGGGSNTSGPLTTATLIEHWTGQHWQVVASPSPDPSLNSLNGVTALSANNLWAVGYAGNNTLIEHWTGQNWQVVASPSPGKTDNFLYAVAATSPTDVWAVGNDASLGLFHTLIEHWDGTTWSAIASPSVKNYANYLTGVTALSANNLWAVGFYYNEHNLNVPMIEHWDGKSWRIVHSPSARNAVVLNAVAAVDAHDIWAVGAASLTEHWNGTRWRIIPADPIYAAAFAAVSALASNDVWTVGDYAIAEHWNGSQWQLVPSQKVPGNLNDLLLLGVSGTSPRTLWAVGYYQTRSGLSYTLIEHYC